MLLNLIKIIILYCLLLISMKEDFFFKYFFASLNRVISSQTFHIIFCVFLEFASGECEAKRRRIKKSKFDDLMMAIIIRSWIYHPSNNNNNNSGKSNNNVCQMRTHKEKAEMEVLDCVYFSSAL